MASRSITPLKLVLEPGAAEPPPCARPAPARRGRVMVVDDEALLGSAVRRALTSEHDVEVTTSAREALARLTAGAHYDVVLCDLMMPEINGMAFHAELLRAAPRLADRVVFMTGGTYTPEARAFLDNVANARFEKPFDVSALRALVHSYVTGAAARVRR